MAEKTVPTIQSETPVVQREITRNPEYFSSPLVDIYESAEGLTVVADLPGVDKAGLKIQVENHILTIEGKVIEDDKHKPNTLNEFVPTNFFRQFELPEMVDQKKILAELKHGVLTLTLPKAESAKPKKIEVKVTS